MSCCPPIYILYVWIDLYLCKSKKSLKYQRGNQNPYNEEEQTTQWPNEKGQNDKQRSTKQTHKTKDRVTRSPLKTKLAWFQRRKRKVSVERRVKTCGRRVEDFWKHFTFYQPHFLIFSALFKFILYIHMHYALFVKKIPVLMGIFDSDPEYTWHPCSRQAGAILIFQKLHH